MTKFHFHFLLVFLSWIFQFETKAQNLLVDEQISAGGLNLYASRDDPNKLYYVTDHVVLAKNEDGSPKFSFIRYVDNSASTGIEGDGGGLVHFVVSMQTTPKQRQDAETELQQIRPGAHIIGPVAFTSGVIGLVSVTAKPDGKMGQDVVGFGNAPLLENEQAAFSILLTKKGAKLLWESFDTKKSDLSVSFEMNIRGLSSPKEVIVDASFDKLYENKTMQLAAAVHGPIMVGAEINAAFEDMRQSNTISVTVVGDDAYLEKALESVYSKLRDAMFEPIGGTGVPTMEQAAGATGIGKESLLEKATNNLNAERDKATARNDAIINEERTWQAEEERLQKEVITAEDIAPPAKPAGDKTKDDISLRDDVVVGPRSITKGPDEGKSKLPPDPSLKKDRAVVPKASILASFQMKKVHQSGVFHMDLNKYVEISKLTNFDGDIEIKKSDCPKCFKEVNMEDIINEIRIVNFSVNNVTSDDFGKYISFANVTMDKVHENGEHTLRETKIDKNTFTEKGNNFIMNYGWKGDNDRDKFYSYKYKVVWNFNNGYVQESDWMTSKIGAVGLNAPFTRQTIDIEADPENFTSNNIRSCEIKIYFKLGDKEQMVSKRLISKTNIMSAQLDILAPPGDLAYEYEKTWFLNDGSTKTTGKLKSQNTFLLANFN